jgi:triosephosphate isomerase
MDKHEIALEQCWEIATDNSITEDNKVKMIRDISRATLDGEPTTADEYNEEEDVQIGASIVKSNKEVSGVFMVDGKIKDVDYFKKGEEL